MIEDSTNPDGQTQRSRPDSSRSPLSAQRSALSASSLALVAAASVGAMLAAAACAVGEYVVAAWLAAASLAVGVALSGRVSIEAAMIGWFVTEPVASFFVRFPVEKSILTYDRVVFASLAFVALLESRKRRAANRRSFESSVSSESSVLSSRSEPILNPESRMIAASRSQIFNLSLSKFEIAWGLLCALASASVAVKSENVGAAARLAVDSFCLPLVAFHLARHRFDARNRAGALLVAAIALALLLFAFGAYEITTGANLFQYKGSELMRDGERRVNGPFASDSSYAIICLMMALFLKSAPRFLRMRLDAGARWLHVCAVVAAVAASLLPLFRSVALALVICWIVSGTKRKNTGDEKQKERKSFQANRRAVAALLALMIIAAASLAIEWDSFSERLTSSRNVYGRVATWQAAASIALDQPVFGVGLANYGYYFHDKYRGEWATRESALDARAADSPHSNLLWIAAELGFIGFALYAIANVYIFLMGYRAFIRAKDARQRASAACYLALVIAYWIPGLTLASGVYSDLNLYFFFTLGLLLNISRDRAESYAIA